MAGIMMNDDPKVMMMNVDLNWSKYQDERSDRFLTFGNDLKLHQVESFKESNKIFGGIQLSDVNHSNITAKINMHNVKSMACNNTLLTSNTDVLFAIGYNSGRILLNSFDPNSNPTGLIGKEFVPKFARACNTIDFNPQDNNLLASGYDKARNECSIVVWDIAHTGNLVNNPYHNQFGTGLNKPLYEFAPNEVVHSLKWFQNKTIICGMNNKHIKIFDLRDVNKPRGVITKGVYGITLDPLSNYRFATFADNHIYVWDTRYIENPMTTIGPEVSSIVKLEWCPTRSNILAALLKDTNSIKLYDYKDYKNHSAENEPSVLAREISPFEISNPQIISSFSWHPYSESRMAVISSNGIIRDFKVIDRITLNWSPVSEIIWTHGKKILQCIDSRDSLYQNIDDIAVRMRKFAIEGYGLSSDKLWQLFQRNTPLYYVWKWMAIRIVPNPGEKSPKAGGGDSKNSAERVKDLFSLHSQERLYGLLGVLFNDNRSQLLHSCEPASIADSNLLSKRKVYTSLSRAKALQHCGWSSRSRYLNIIDLDMSAVDLNGSSSGHAQTPTNQSSISTLFDGNMPCDQFIEMNEEEFNFSRTAAVLVFNGKLFQAIECLKRASEMADKMSDKLAATEKRDTISMNVIALTLSAYITAVNQSARDDKAFLWSEMCSTLMSKLKDSYIKAIFTFLSITCFDDNCYDEIINDSNLDIADRVAFACMYLSNPALERFLINLRASLFERADLSAILLTGVTEEGLELFSKYIENTCDVQTISLILLWSLPSAICKKSRSKAWIENYKQLLDCWRLWKVRAQFDIKWYAGLNHMEDPKPNIYLSCNYCRASLSTSITNESGKVQMNYPTHVSHHQFNRNAAANNTAGSKYRTVSCSNCAKTLPRCSLCLTQLGTAAGIYWRPGLLFSKSDRKLSPFSSWFTWCQTCRHGGHSAHLLGWFSENSICPVAGCKCKCMSMDANANAHFYKQ